MNFPNSALFYLCLTALGSLCFGTEPAARFVVTSPVRIEITSTPDDFLTVETGFGHILTACRPYVATRPVGAAAWMEETVGYQVVSRNPERIELKASFSRLQASVTMKRDRAGRWELSGQLKSTGKDPIEVARFHYLDGLITDPAAKLLSVRQFEHPGGWASASQRCVPPREMIEKWWGGMRVLWPRISDPLHDRADVGISGDLGFLSRDANTPGLFVGFTGPGTAFGELGIRTGIKASFYAGVLLDGIRIEPGACRLLETAIISRGDWQEELEHWTTACRNALKPVRVSPPIAGYCSWYQTFRGVQPEHIRRAIQSFAGYEGPPGGRLIQIDDGYQVMAGDWSGRGAWKTELEKLPAEIAARGFIPGIWVAPTAISRDHPIIKEHPEWLQRDSTGQPCLRFSNWGPTYFLDPDEPGARQFITGLLHGLRAQGWKYFKIDFAYTVSTARMKPDPRKTSFETLRDQWKLFREALGDDAIVNACVGGIYRYTVGSVDLARVGGDINSDFNSVRRNLAEMLWRLPTNGIWFQADPDVFYMRPENSKLSFEESRLLTETFGMLGTAFLTSDFADQWKSEAVPVVRRYWNRSGPRVPTGWRSLTTAEGFPSAIGIANEANEYQVALYNWSDRCADTHVTLRELRLPEDETYHAATDTQDPEPVAITGGTLQITAQPAHSIRIVRLGH